MLFFVKQNKDQIKQEGSTRLGGHKPDPENHKTNPNGWYIRSMHKW